MTAVYAGFLVVATHMPRLHVSLDLATSVPPDKLIHFFAYGVLGFLTGLVATEAGVGWRRWFPLVLVGIAAFALLDETTQPMFGRDAEPFDWVADVVGAAAGLCAAASLAAAARAFKGPAISP
ncbi:MAG: VanZ family protein [Planctomycetia bacterium]